MPEVDQCGFKLKAINHKISGCQTYIRHFSQFSILAKVLKTKIMVRFLDGAIEAQWAG